jgi:NTP pyrophosphatase (non-canonical NTP hydrolase)
MTDTRDLKALGKLAEELSECAAAVARCIIQGIDESEPVTHKPNRQWLEEEIADVRANISLVVARFGLDTEKIEDRERDKYVRLRAWQLGA